MITTRYYRSFPQYESIVPALVASRYNPILYFLFRLASGKYLRKLLSNIEAKKDEK